MVSLRPQCLSAWIEGAAALCLYANARPVTMERRTSLTPLSDRHEHTPSTYSEPGPQQRQQQQQTSPQPQTHLVPHGRIPPRLRPRSSSSESSPESRSTTATLRTEDQESGAQIFRPQSLPKRKDNMYRNPAEILQRSRRVQTQTPLSSTVFKFRVGEGISDRMRGPRAREGQGCRG